MMNRLTVDTQLQSSSAPSCWLLRLSTSDGVGSAEQRGSACSYSDEVQFRCCASRRATSRRQKAEAAKRERVVAGPRAGCAHATHPAVPGCRAPPQRRQLPRCSRPTMRRTFRRRTRICTDALHRRPPGGSAARARSSPGPKPSILVTRTVPTEASTSTQCCYPSSSGTPYPNASAHCWQPSRWRA